MTILLATGSSGYLLSRLRSDYAQLTSDIDLSIQTLTAETPIPEQSTVLLAGWPTRLNYDSTDHLDFLDSCFFPLMRRISESPGSRVITFGTCLEYGISNLHCHEDFPVTPTCNLGIAKARIPDLADSLNLQYCHLRIFYPYNFDHPRDRTLLHYLSQHIASATSEPFPCSLGFQLRDFFHTSVLTRAIASLKDQSWDSIPQIVNICSGIPRNVRDIMTRYVRYHNESVSFNYGEVPMPTYEPLNFYGSAARLARLVNPSYIF